VETWLNGGWFNSQTGCWKKWEELIAGGLPGTYSQHIHLSFNVVGNIIGKGHDAYYAKDI
jgi:hypothetical protein